MPLCKAAGELPLPGAVGSTEGAPVLEVEASLLTGFFLSLRFVFCRGEGTDIARVSGVSQDTGQEWLMRNWLRNF